MFMIGLLEDEEFVYSNWEILAEDSELSCEVLWFEDEQSLNDNLSKIDLLIVDRNLGDLDIIESGLIPKIRERFSGPILLSSVANPSKQEKALFDKILYNKNPPSIKNLYLFYQQACQPLPL